MTQRRVLMSAPDVGDLEEQYVVSALRSGWVAPLGPDVDAFEQSLASRVEVEHCVALSSGTAALHLGLLALSVGPGDVVVTSTMTFAATANAIMYTGAEPYFVDCLEETGNIDPDLLNEALVELSSAGERVAAVVPVDLLGKSADYSMIEPIAAEYGVPVLADAAESLGAKHRGRPAGSFGRAAVLSFNGNKIMTTSGGGALLTNDASLAATARFLSTQAREPVVHYEHKHVGYNYRLSNILAALGRAQLERLDSMIARRRAIRTRYRNAIRDTRGVSIFAGSHDEDDNCWLTSLVVDEPSTGWSAQDLREHLASKAVECRPLWKPMHLQPVFEGARGKVTGAAESLFRRGLTLPSGSSLTDDELEIVESALSEFFGTHNGQ